MKKIIGGLGFWMAVIGCGGLAEGIGDSKQVLAAVAWIVIGVLMFLPFVIEEKRNEENSIARSISHRDASYPGFLRRM